MALFSKMVALCRHPKGTLINKQHQDVHQSANGEVETVSDNRQWGSTPAAVMIEMIRAAYQLPKGPQKRARDHVPPASLLGKGWEVLCCSSDQHCTSRYGYKAVAAINHDTQQILIATAGTKPTEKYDLWDNCKLLAGSLPIFRRFVSCVPNKLRPAQQFLDTVIAKACGEQKAAHYVFNTCGHSLGAVMADVTAAEMLSRGLKIGRSTTFENPGSRGVVARVVADKRLPEPTVQQLAEHCTEYNSWRSYINSFGSRLAQKVHLVVPPVSADNSTMVWPAVGEKSGYFSQQVQRGARYFGFFEVAAQLRDHRLGNFSRLDQGTCYSVAGWDHKQSSLSFTRLPEAQEQEQNSPTEDQLGGEEQLNGWACPARPQTFVMEDVYAVNKGQLARLGHMVAAVAVLTTLNYFQKRGTVDGVVASTNATAQGLHPGYKQRWMQQVGCASQCLDDGWVSFPQGAAALPVVPALC